MISKCQFLFLCWITTFHAALAEHSVPGNAGIIPRAGKTGPRMLLGTSVMDAAQNQLVKSLGFSHGQTDSDPLAVNQPYPGFWDWTSADAGLAAMQAAGMKWQYFPRFHWAPEWYRQSSLFVPCTGLRSGRKLAAISVWSPDIVPWFDACYAALAAHYGGGPNKIFALYLGIHGDFGETIFPMGWHPDEIKRFGTNGTGMPDFWCGDDSARTDFRLFARSKHGALPELNAAWGTPFGDFDRVDFPPAAYHTGIDVTATPQSRRYWLDFLEWYYGGMTHFAGQVCRIARHYFPDALLEIPIGGGSENVMYAQDTTELPKIAGRYGVHVRSTHGGYASFAQAYAGMIKRIDTPCKIYGVSHWLEPPGAITPENEVARFMEALSCGNFGFWDWGANPVGAPGVFRAYTNFFTREQPVVDVALFFPTTDHRLHPDIDFPRRLHDAGVRLRDKMDYDMVDEELIDDGALSHYRVLVWAEGRFIEQKRLEAITKWVEQGGVLVHWGVDSPETVEGQTDLGHSLLGFIGGAPFTARGKGRVIVVASTKETDFDNVVLQAAFHLSAMKQGSADAVELKTASGVYATLLANGEILLYNSTDAPFNGVVAGAVVAVPPKSLRSFLRLPATGIAR